jgi:hypothetical protein
MANTRYEITIAYTDRKGEKRYMNNVGALFLGDDGRGSIVLPPGVALVGGGDHYINVQLPRPKEAGAASGGGAPRGGQREPNASYPQDDSDNVPF